MIDTSSERSLVKVLRAVMGRPCSVAHARAFVTALAEHPRLVEELARATRRALLPFTPIADRRKKGATLTIVTARILIRMSPTIADIERQRRALDARFLELGELCAEAEDGLEYLDRQLSKLRARNRRA